MLKYTILLLVICFCKYSFSQNPTAQELLEKTIAYHDPNNRWDTFKGTLNITMAIPNQSKRDSHIDIDIPNEYFQLITKRDSTVITYVLDKGDCIISKQDSIRIANLLEKPKRSHCEMTQLFKNYYTYLYGLPMKLRDSGTLIDETVEDRVFKGKRYLVLKVSYEEGVGNDLWYFYFDPKTFAMEIYQFFRTDERGSLKPKSGEYILLSEETNINGIKMPKVRAWYYNNEDKYLGTDTLKP